MTDRRRQRRASAARFAVPVALAVAGVAVVAAADGTLRIIGWGVISIAVTIAISLAFLEVGYSEDRARARERPPRDGAGSQRP